MSNSIQPKDTIVAIVNLSDIYEKNIDIVVEAATKIDGSPITGTTKKGAKNQKYQITLDRPTNDWGFQESLPSVDCDTHGIQEITPWCELWGPEGMEGAEIGIDITKVQVLLKHHTYTDDEGVEKEKYYQSFHMLSGAMVKPSTKKEAAKVATPTLEVKTPAEPTF